MAFSMQERFHINILATGLTSLGLSVGPWISHFKSLIYQNADPNTLITIPGGVQDAPRRSFELGGLAEKIAVVSNGYKLAYVTDVVFSSTNAEKIIALARNADHLFIEAAFLESERQIASEKYHLTAHQAGTLAHQAGAQQMTIFHHSPRYMGRSHLLNEEARRAFEGQK